MGGLLASHWVAPMKRFWKVLGWMMLAYAPVAFAVAWLFWEYAYPYRLAAGLVNLAWAIACMFWAQNKVPER